jgi:hypothetical protein
MVDEHEQSVTAVVDLLRVTAAIACDRWELSPSPYYYYGDRGEYIVSNLLLLLEALVLRVGGNPVSLCFGHDRLKSRRHFDNARLYHYCGRHSKMFVHCSSHSFAHCYETATDCRRRRRRAAPDAIEFAANCVTHSL